MRRAAWAAVQPLRRVVPARVRDSTTRRGFAVEPSPPKPAEGIAKVQSEAVVVEVAAQPGGVTRVAAKAEANAVASTTAKLKREQQKSTLIKGTVALGVVGGAAYCFEDVKLSTERFWNLYTQPGMDNQTNILPPSQQPGMKTLVLDLEETLVHFSWDRGNGWRCSKRPGFDLFLDYVASYGLYEVVVFSNGYSMSVEPWLERLDPVTLTAQNQITVRLSHRLFRDHARLIEAKEQKKWVWSKDLTALNREMTHIVLVDKEGDEPWQPQPNNCIAVPRWDGDPDDTALLDILPMLEALAMPDVPDVREVIKQHKPRSAGEGLADHATAADVTGAGADDGGAAAEGDDGAEEEAPSISSSTHDHLSMVDSFRLAQRHRRKQVREYMKSQRMFNNPQQLQMLQQSGGLGPSAAECASGEVTLQQVQVQRLPPERQTMTPIQLERQMAETMQMQLQEFDEMDSPLPGGVKIPKIPGSTDDLRDLFNNKESEESDMEKQAKASVLMQAEAAKEAEAVAAKKTEGGGGRSGIFSRQQ